jgi:hypothetical protein
MQRNLGKYWLLHKYCESGESKQDLYMEIVPLDRGDLDEIKHAISTGADLNAYHDGSLTSYKESLDRSLYTPFTRPGSAAESVDECTLLGEAMISFRKSIGVYASQSARVTN